MFSTLQTILAADVATSGTFTVGYPSGTNRGSFVNGVDHKILVNQRLYTAPNDFTISFGAASATITWGGANTLTAGSSVRVQLDQPGGADIDGVNRTVACSLVYVDLGNPATSDDDALRAAAAIGGAGALVLIAAGQTFDVPRNVIITNAGDDTGDTYTVTGEDEYGDTMVETITGANAGIAAGKKAFKTITSISASGASAGTVKIGFGDVLGLPLHVPITGEVLKEIQDSAIAAAGTLVAGLSPLTKATATNADVRGTYDPNAACDGAKTFQLVIALPDPTFLGVPQYAG